MLLVLDTNIIVNSLLASSEESKSVKLMGDVFAGKHKLCVSAGILEEYREVLSRPRFKIPEETVAEVINWIDRNSVHIEPLPTTPDRVEMGDEDDRMFFDLAKCMGARLVTRNYKHYPVHELVTLIDELY